MHRTRTGICAVTVGKLRINCAQLTGTGIEWAGMVSGNCFCYRWLVVHIYAFESCEEVGEVCFGAYFATSTAFSS